MEYVHRSFPGMFTEEPKFANVSYGVKFEITENSIEVGYVWVWKSGRMDFQKCVDVEIGDDGSIVFDLNHVVEAILTLVKAMNIASYWKIYKQSRWHLSRRFDWYVSISTSIRRNDGMTVTWSDAVFPGRRPMRAGGSVQAVCPQGGYAKNDLRSWSPRTGGLTILNPFLNDFLLQNGFYNCEESVHDIVNQPHIVSLLDSSASYLHNYRLLVSGLITDARGICLFGRALSRTSTTKRTSLARIGSPSSIISGVIRPRVFSLIEESRINFWIPTRAASRIGIAKV